MIKAKSSRKWVLRFVLICAALGAACLWARLRPANRFEFRDVSANELRLVTWNVGYFAPVKNKNLRDVDLGGVVEILRDVSADVAVIQELGSIDQANAIATALGEQWKAHYVETGHQGQILAVLSKLQSREVIIREAGGRNLVGVSLVHGRW